MHFVGGIFPVFQNFFFVRIVAPGLWGVRQRRGCGFCFGDSSECPARPSGREGLASASPLRRPLSHRRRAKGAALSRVPAGRAHRPSRGPRPRPRPGGPFPEQAHFVPVLIGRLVRVHSVLPTSEPCSLNERRVAAAASW